MGPGRVRLTRELRFQIPLKQEDSLDAPVLNSWSGWPSTASLAPFLCVRCTLQGPVDPQTDYVCNVKEVDCLLREHAIAPICRNADSTAAVLKPSELLAEIWRRTGDFVPQGTALDALQLLVSPFLTYELCRARFPMVQISQQFEFSASHRLHNHTLSADENQRLYGKCNNPHGHGHNYVLELTLEIPPGDAAGYSTHETERIVKSKIIDRLDHRHLNIEVSPFDRLNPTVENIAVTIWGWLANEFTGNQRISRVRVYETPKTWADYYG